MTEREMVYALARLITDGKGEEAEELAKRYVDEYGSWLVFGTLMTSARKLATGVAYESL